MQRYTTRATGKATLLDLSQEAEAIAKLADFEDLLEELLAAQTEIPAELERLRLAGKEKSVRYKELLGTKLLNNHAVALFRDKGLC